MDRAVGADQVDAQDGLEGVGVHVAHQPAADPGVHDDGVDAAEPLDGSVDGRLRLLAVGHVAWKAAPRRRGRTPRAQLVGVEPDHGRSRRAPPRAGGLGTDAVPGAVM